MNYVTIINNKVASTRQGQSIVVGEIENVDNLQCGMELIDGEWKFPPQPPPQPSELDLIKDRLSMAEDAVNFILMI